MRHIAADADPSRRDDFYHANAVVVVVYVDSAQAAVGQPEEREA